MTLAEAVREALAHVPASFAGVDDAELLLLVSELAAARRVIDSRAASAAGEIERRSARELGHSGLAQAAGFASAQRLVQSISGSTRAEATKLVHIGTLATTPESTWQAPLADTVALGTLSVDAADAIRRGLGEPDAAVSPAQLRDESERLIASASTHDADQLFRLARQRRDELDVASVERREKQQRDLRYFRVYARTDGMVAGSFLLDPEDGETLVSAIDGAIGPRRGGPRFTDKAANDALMADPRSNDQLTADAVVAMLRLAVDADPGTMFGRRRPAVRVLVTGSTLSSRAGSGSLEGKTSAVSLATIDRHVCDTGVVGVKFDDDGQCVNVGREKRLFTTRQRIGMAARDGGCRAPGCDRPPSQCEAHHINEWMRDSGRTDIADGVLLCRFHHLNFHNNGWRVIREGGKYWVVPPASVDRDRKPIPMPSKSPYVFARV